jgi:hypothetical protein
MMTRDDDVCLDVCPFGRRFVKTTCVLESAGIPTPLFSDFRTGLLQQFAKRRVLNEPRGKVTHHPRLCHDSTMLLFSSIIADPPRPCFLFFARFLPPSPVAHRRCLPSRPPLLSRRQPRCNRNPRHRAHHSFQKNATVKGSDSLITHWSAWYMSPPRLPTTTPECTTQPQTESPDPRVNSCPPLPISSLIIFFSGDNEGRPEHALAAC